MDDFHFNFLLASLLVIPELESNISHLHKIYYAWVNSTIAY